MKYYNINVILYQIIKPQKPKNWKTFSVFSSLWKSAKTEKFFQFCHIIWPHRQLSQNVRLLNSELDGNTDVKDLEYGIHDWNIYKITDLNFKGKFLSSCDIR